MNETCFEYLDKETLSEELDELLEQDNPSREQKLRILALIILLSNTNEE